MPPGRHKSGKITMQDIADRLGISKVSVSKAMNRKPGVSNALRRTIFSTAMEMGYEGIPAEKPQRFAFIVSQHFFLETDLFYSKMYYQFNQECLEKGISTSLIIVSHKNVQQGELPTQLVMEEFNGIAVAGEMPDKFLRLVKKLDVPMVLMDFDSTAVDACSLVTANYHWSSRVTQRLIDLGHKKIGFVGRPGSTKSITDRYFGYRRSLLLNGLPYKEEWVLINNDPGTGLYTPNIDFPEDMPTAFVCHCDMAAYYLLIALKQRGLQCPKDVSVISFDNTRLAETCSPPLTSVAIDTKAFAHKAIELLAGPECHDARQRFHMPASLVERESVAPPNTD